MARVVYRQVKKSYGAVQVLNGLDLAVEDGEFVVLLGASGCGKTTLLRMTAGLESISAGEIEIDDRVVNDVHPRDRDIAMVFQNYALYPTMRVSENISFSLEVAGLEKAEIDKKVAAAAHLLNLTDYLDRYPKELSGGQRQRVAMGRAMVRNAKVFLFDEPLSNLDAKLRAHMRVEIRQLHNRLKATTIYVTHDQIEAMTMADKIVLMHGGNIVQVGSQDDLYDRPNCKYVAEFVGTPSINCLYGGVETAAGGVRFVSGDVALDLPSAMAAHAGRKVIAGVRPSDVRIDPQGAIRGALKITEKTGADIQLHMEVNGSEFVAVARRDMAAKLGENLAVSVPSGKIHVFDGETERRLPV